MYVSVDNLAKLNTKIVSQLNSNFSGFWDGVREGQPNAEYPASNLLSISRMGSVSARACQDETNVTGTYIMISI